MKSKLLIATLLVGLVSQRWAMSQTDTNSVATNQPAMSESAPAVQPAAAAETTAAVDTNAATTPAAGTDATPAATSSNETTSATDTNAPALTATNTESATGGGDTNETASTTGNAPVATPTVLPIQFQDVPITTAIENLARLADINYLLDPRIGYGQPDQNGQIKPEPTISVRWENVSARQALLAVLDNYNLELVEDPKTKIARIGIKNPNAPPPLVTRVIQLKYASVSNMEAAVESALTDKRSRVVMDSRTSQLVVVATENEQDAVDTLVEQLDKPTRQVLIETRLMEVSSSPTTTKGIDWSGTLSGQNVTFGNNVNGGQIGSPYSTSITFNTNVPSGFPILEQIAYGPNNLLQNPSLLVNTMHGFDPATAFLNADGVKAVLSFLNQDSDAQTIATPRVVTLDNETAHIEVTRAVPIFATTAGTQGSPGGSQVTYTNLGTILDVTPRISANDYIWLTVAPEVSSVFDTVTKIVAGVENQADEYDVRKVTTQVLIPNANTLVMGGFIKDNTKNIYTKVPVLGDIPVLGYAFRSENKGLDKDNLLIFLTPTIVKDTDYQPTSSQFLQSSPLGPKPPMNPLSMWNSAKPRDWSDPKNTDPYYNVANQTSTEWQTTPSGATGSSATTNGTINVNP
ncbi:MAG TPA: secretin N-terminal domain-containing protein [Verrucomicrobiae bacterium]|nr:secretin N-terminal domain-containing protein [Verrucomicrobiae bacterium]